MLVHLPDADSYLIGYSGGKDSLAVLDLAVKSGRRTEAFFMYFLAGLDYTAYWTGLARRRWGVRVHEYLHWNTVEYLRAGLFRAAPVETRKVTIKDIERRAREDSGIEWIGYGYKATDSLHRRGMLNRWPGGIAPDGPRGRIFAPLKHWNDNDVKSYLAWQRIPLPATDGAKRNSGISLSPFALAWMRAAWPDDYRRILKVFPYAIAQADRAEEVRAQIAAAKAARLNAAAATSQKPTPEVRLS
jgi:3'-phosphoadenosine 5'-phosphosulfate sulfotransferase (PAPS reductase)/FAD synthetase